MEGKTIILDASAPEDWIIMILRQELSTYSSNKGTSAPTLGWLHQQSPITRESNVIQQNRSKSKSPMVKAKWISQLLFSFPSLKQKRTALLYIQKRCWKTPWIFLFLLVFFTVYKNWQLALMTEIKFLCRK